MKKAAAALAVAAIALSSQAQTVTVTPGVHIGPSQRIAPFHLAQAEGAEYAVGVVAQGKEFLAVTAKGSTHGFVLMATPIDTDGVPQRSRAYLLAGDASARASLATTANGAMIVIGRGNYNTPSSISVLPLPNGRPGQEIALANDATGVPAIGCNDSRCLVTWPVSHGAAGAFVTANGVAPVPVPAAMSSIAADPNGFAGLAGQRFVRIDTSGAKTFDIGFTLMNVVTSAVVFNGTDYVIFWTTSVPDYHLYATRVRVDGTIAETRTVFDFLGGGNGAHQGYQNLRALWDGHQYLLTFGYAVVWRSIYAAALDHTFTPLHAPEQIEPESPSALTQGAAWNGQSYYTLSTMEQPLPGYAARGALLTPVARPDHRDAISIGGRTQHAIDLLSGASTKLAIWYETDGRVEGGMYAQRLDSQGSPIGDPITLSATLPVPYRNRAGAIGGDEYVVYADGKAIIIHADGSTTPIDLAPLHASLGYLTIAGNGKTWLVASPNADTGAIETHLFTPSGQRINAAPIIAGVSASAVRAISDGENYLIAWQAGTPRCLMCPTQPSYSVIASDGTILHSQAFGPRDALFDMAAAPGGEGFAIAWTEYAYPPDDEVTLLRIDHAGNPRAEQRGTAPIAHRYIYNFDLVRFDGGWLLETYFGGLHLGTRFADDGSHASHPFVFDVGNESLQFLASNNAGTVDALYWTFVNELPGVDTSAALVMKPIFGDPLFLCSKRSTR